MLPPEIMLLQRLFIPFLILFYIQKSYFNAYFAFKYEVYHLSKLIL